jgi:hypothetical protein
MKLRPWLYRKRKDEGQHPTAEGVRRKGEGVGVKKEGKLRRRKRSGEAKAILLYWRKAHDVLFRRKGHSSGPDWLGGVRQG